MKTTHHTKLNVTGLHTLYLPVSQVSASSAWYAQHFGMQIVQELEQASTLKLANGPAITLVQSTMLNTYESVPFGIRAHDARRAYQHLQKANIKASEPNEWLQYVEFNFWDPDGNMINVISDPSWPNMPNNFFDINGLFIGLNSFDDTFHWYKSIFGEDIEYDFTMSTTSLENARVKCFRDIQLSLFDSPHGKLCMKVADYLTSNIEEDALFLKENGVKVSNLIEVEQKKVLSFWDPNGIEIGLVELIAI